MTDKPNEKPKTNEGKLLEKVLSKHLAIDGETLNDCYGDEEDDATTKYYCKADVVIMLNEMKTEASQEQFRKDTDERLESIKQARLSARREVLDEIERHKSKHTGYGRFLVEEGSYKCLAGKPTI